MIPLEQWSRAANQNAPHGEGVDDEWMVMEELCSGLIESAAAAMRVHQGLIMRRVAADALSASIARLTGIIESEAERQASQIGQLLRNALRPWIGQRIEEQAITSFCEAVKTHLREELPGAAHVKAPAALLKRTDALLADSGVILEPMQGSDGTFVLNAGQTQLRSNIAAWQARVERLLSC